MSEKGGVGPKTHKACARQRQKSGALNTLINVKALHTMSFKFKLFLEFSKQQNLWLMPKKVWFKIVFAPTKAFYYYYYTTLKLCFFKFMKKK